MLNLKVAFALLERGLRVTLIVQSPQVLSQLMEPEDAALIRNALNNAGLKIQTGAGPAGFFPTATGSAGYYWTTAARLPVRWYASAKGCSRT